jgi:hypothetical protein
MRYSPTWLRDGRAGPGVQPVSRGTPWVAGGWWTSDPGGLGPQFGHCHLIFSRKVAPWNQRRPHLGPRNKLPSIMNPWYVAG